MNFNKWTLARAAAGVVSLGSIAQAEEAQHAVATALSSTTLSGYVDTSAVWKFGTGNESMPGRSYDGTSKQDGFNLDVVKLTLEKPLDEGQWAAGYKADVLAGPDANSFRTITGASSEDFGIEQAYVNLRAPVGNGLDFKMGVFDTIVGYETFDSYKNPNFSRSYGYNIEPVQHTGVLASYQVAEWLGFQAGVANTINSPINARAERIGTTKAESEKTYMGGITLTAPESMGFLKGATLYGAIINGLNGNNDNNDNPSKGLTAYDMTHYYVGATIPTPLTGLSVGAAYDYRANGSYNPASPAASSYANATALYLSYQATEKLKLNNRVEYATGTKGTFFSNDPTSSNYINDARHNDEVVADTFTVDYSLWANVVTRAEFRVDHYLDGQPGAYGLTGNGLDNNALSLALNVIYKF
jgi:hypothetical protein